MPRGACHSVHARVGAQVAPSRAGSARPHTAAGPSPPRKRSMPEGQRCVLRRDQTPLVTACPGNCLWPGTMLGRRAGGFGRSSDLQRSRPRGGCDVFVSFSCRCDMFPSAPPQLARWTRPRLTTLCAVRSIPVGRQHLIIVMRGQTCTPLETRFKPKSGVWQEISGTSEVADVRWAALDCQPSDYAAPLDAGGDRRAQAGRDAGQAAHAKEEAV